MPTTSSLRPSAGLLLARLAAGVVLVALVMAFLGCVRHDRFGPSVAERLRDEGLQKAAAENKRLLLWFSAAGSEWCELLGRFHQAPEVAALFSQYFVEVEIDIHQTPGGLILYSAMGNDRGVPAFTILDGKGAVLADSGTESQSQNVGFPSSDEERERYLVAIKTVCPDISEDQLRLLREKLLEIWQSYVAQDPDATPGR